MLNLSAMVNLDVAEKLSRATLWGETDGELVKSLIINGFLKSNVPILKVNLGNINAFDHRFLEVGLVEACQKLLSQYHGNRALVIKVPEDSNLESELEYVFQLHHVSAVIETKDRYRVSDYSNFRSQLIFDKLVNKSPIVSSVVCGEIGGNLESSLEEFDNLVSIGVAKEIRAGIYSSVLFKRSFAKRLRHAFKSLKLLFWKEPLYKMLDRLDFARVK